MEGERATSFTVRELVKQLLELDMDAEVQIFLNEQQSSISSVALDDEDSDVVLLRGE